MFLCAVAIRRRNGDARRVVTLKFELRLALLPIANLEASSLYQGVVYTTLGY